MPYTMHCGQALEECPQRRGPLFLHNVEGWYDFFANAASTDADGYLDDHTIGMKHVAVRDAGRDSVFKPNKANIGPRKKEWKPTETNTQQPHRK